MYKLTTTETANRNQLTTGQKLDNCDQNSTNIRKKIKLIPS